MLKTSPHFPFSNLTSEAKQNLVLMLVGIFYAGMVVWIIKSNILCGNMSVDFCAYWSTGQLINLHGFGQMYNMAQLADLQLVIYPQPFETIPFPYPPVFALPFPLFARIPLPISFGVWTLLNGAGLAGYILFFYRKVTGKTLPLRWTMVTLLSVPVSLNLLYGQINVFLAIGAGEFIRGMIEQKPYRAGAWLAGMLLKPQTLVLLIPYLLLQRNWRALAGFAASSAFVGLASFALVGVQGLTSLANIVAGSAVGVSASHYEIMMNWRMIGTHISWMTTPWIGSAVLIAGTLATLAFTFNRLRLPDTADSTAWQITVLGILAASGAVTWHAHFSMMIMLYPAFITLAAEKRLSTRFIGWWLFMPVFVMILIFILAHFVNAKIFPPTFSDVQHLITGSRGFVLNIALLLWAAREAKAITTV